MIKASMAELKAAFTEWDRRFREDPEGFQAETERLALDSPETYGDACGPYFAKILEEIRAQQ